MEMMYVSVNVNYVLIDIHMTDRLAFHIKIYIVNVYLECH